MPASKKDVDYAAVSTTNQGEDETLYQHHVTNYESNGKTCWWFKLPEKITTPLEVKLTIFKIPAGTDKIGTVKHIINFKSEKYTTPKAVVTYLEGQIEKSESKSAPKEKKAKASGKKNHKKTVTAEVVKPAPTPDAARAKNLMELRKVAQTRAEEKEKEKETKAS